MDNHRETRPCVVVAMVEREDGRILVVWDPKYGQWVLPLAEAPADASAEDVGGLAREQVRARTGAVALAADLVHEGNIGRRGLAGQRALVFRCAVAGEAREVSLGCPVTWFSREEVLRHGIVPEFFGEVFAAVEALSPASRVVAQEVPCDGCGGVGRGARTPDGWYVYPPGWFVFESEEGSACACSLACVGRVESSSGGAVTHIPAPRSTSPGDP